MSRSYRIVGDAVGQFQALEVLVQEAVLDRLEAICDGDVELPHEEGDLGHLVPLPYVDGYDITIVVIQIQSAPDGSGTLEIISVRPTTM